MDEHSVEVAQANEKEGLAKVRQVLPKRLAEKEDRLVEWHARLKGNQRTKLLALYDFMAELYRPLAPLTPCNKGCASCCYYPVSVSDVEIDIIERGTGRKRIKKLGPAGDCHGQPCPFLAKGACSIYDYRPYVCRRHLSLTKTPYWCHPDRANEAEFQQLRFSEVELVFKLILAEGTPARPVDIRQVFQ